jgi:hypothetical protein
MMIPQRSTIRFIDIDFTMYRTTATTTVRGPDGEVRAILDAADYNNYVRRPDDVMDFSAFRSAQVFKDTARPIEDMHRVLSLQIEKDPPSDHSKYVFLTARNSFDNLDLFKSVFAEHHDITGMDFAFAGDIGLSTVMGKQVVVTQYLRQHTWDMVMMFDDDQKNLAMLLGFADEHPQSTFVTYHVRDGRVEFHDCFFSGR